jgi:glycosyltransferase involved in cell wall biosynthesis
LCAIGVERIIVTTLPHTFGPEIIPKHESAHVYRVSVWEFLCAMYAPVSADSIENIYATDRPTLIHSHGLWTFTNHAGAVLARRRKLPLIISAHGMLREWALNHKRLKKRLAWWLYQGRDLQSARVLHATSSIEAEEIRRLDLNIPIALIPHGVEIPPAGERLEHPPGVRTALFLSRIHPVKGLLNLVEAWSRVRPAGWRVVVAGPNENGHEREVKDAVRNKGLDHAFTFVGPQEGPAKWHLFRQADIFVLPTFTENFGMVIAEALGAEIPVITTKGAPWSKLVSSGCGWWVDVGVEPLTAALTEALSLSDEARREMGRRGRRLVEMEYTWTIAANKMRMVYQWVIGADPIPPCVLGNPH